MKTYLKILDENMMEDGIRYEIGKRYKLPSEEIKLRELHTMLKHRCFLLQPLQRIILLLKLNVLHKVHKRKFG